LTALQTLNLFSNALSSTIPQSLANLRQLNEFLVSSNQLASPLPQFLQTRPPIANIDLRDNKYVACASNAVPTVSEAEALGAHQCQCTTYANAAVALVVASSSYSFTCPLPTWCSSSGNSLCTPCRT